MPSLSRRRFCALSGLLPAAILAETSVGRGFAAADEPTSAPTSPLATPAKTYPLGLELYSVRSALARDLTGTLREISRMGYGAVEFYAPYFDWSVPYAKDVRRVMDDLGLRCHSTHNHFESFTPGAGMAKAIELNQVLGTRYLILASTPPGTVALGDWKNLCGRLTVAVGQLSAHGLTAGFHNHQPEWAPLPNGGPRVMDVVAANTPREFVLQFDVGTCLAAGADPIAWIKQNPGRIKSVHLKDWAPGKAVDEKGYRVLFGEGVAPWAEIIAAVESVGGVEYYLMEQESSRYPELETARRCLENWNSLRQKLALARIFHEDGRRSP